MDRTRMASRTTIPRTQELVMDLAIIMLVSCGALALAVISKTYCMIARIKVEDYIEYNAKQDAIRSRVRRQLAALAKPDPIRTAPATVAFRGTLPANTQKRKVTKNPKARKDKVTPVTKVEKPPELQTTIRVEDEFTERQE